MAERDRIKSQEIETPSLERKIGIVTSHCGLSKKEQLEMTFRSHTLLLEEIRAEVEFMAVYPVALYAGKANEVENWIYKKKKGKFDGYITSIEQFNKSMGGDGNVPTIYKNEL